MVIKKNILFLLSIIFLIIPQIILTNDNLLKEENQDNQSKLDPKESLDKEQSKFVCTNSYINCSGKGKCSKNSLDCECFMDYQTYFKNYEDYLLNKPRCNYKSKEQFVALLLSIFLSFGSVYFYLNHIYIGIIQLLLFLAIFYSNGYLITHLSLKHLQKLNRTQVKETFYKILVIIISSTIFFFWYVLDIVMVYLNIYKDSNDAKMKEFYKY